MTQFGPYLIQQELARGGQGAVYLAYHQTLRTPVAIKLLLDPDPRSIKRFKQEARVLSKLKHPNLLKVVDLGEVNGRPYLAMEYIEGLDLKAMYSRRGAPDYDWLLETFDVLAEVLDFIHDHGLVHRDIKPANIFLEDNTNRIILVDFGLVKRDQKIMGLGSLDKSQLSLSGEVAGTPAFMAPEQADPTFGEIGPWTDFYALGSTLYYLLTGHAPFEGSAAYNVLVKLMRDAPVDPREHRADIPAPLVNLIMQCMEKDPALRPQNGAEFANLLHPAPKRPRGRRRLYQAGALILALSGFGGLIHFLTDQGYSPREAEVIAEDIAETPTERPAPTTTPLQPEAPRETIEELMNYISAIPRNDPARLEHINRLIELYPDLYRGYTYRAGTLYEINKTETNASARRRNRQQILADIRRGISLCHEEVKKQRLRSLLERIEREVQ